MKPGLHKAVEAYVSSCKPCQLAKRRTTKPPGHLQEIGVPDQPWEVENMGFVTALPSAGENLNAVLVITCRLSKAIVLIPMETTVDSVRVAQLFYRFGVPRGACHRFFGISSTHLLRVWLNQSSGRLDRRLGHSLTGLRTCLQLFEACVDRSDTLPS